MSISELYRATSPVQPASETSTKGVSPSERSADRGEFEKLLNEKLHVSRHAATRIQSPEIPWDNAMAERISSGIDAAKAKGSREALILADNVAFIANVDSRTVITAMDKAQLKEKVFTNIDSAVLV